MPIEMVRSKFTVSLISLQTYKMDVAYMTRYSSSNSVPGEYRGFSTRAAWYASRRGRFVR